MYSITWWSCLVNQIQFVGYQLKRPHSGHPGKKIKILQHISKNFIFIFQHKAVKIKNICMRIIVCWINICANWGITFLATLHYICFQTLLIRILLWSFFTRIESKGMSIGIGKYLRFKAFIYNMVKVVKQQK